MTKPIIVVKICYKLLYVIQVVKKILISNFLASTVLISKFLVAPVCNAASDWPRTFFTPKVFLFSINAPTISTFKERLNYHWNRFLYNIDF